MLLRSLQPFVALEKWKEQGENLEGGRGKPSVMQDVLGESDLARVGVREGRQPSVLIVAKNTLHCVSVWLILLFKKVRSVGT